jgi:hypothetical protein
MFPGLVIIIPHHIRKAQREGRDDDFAATWGSFALTADANVIIRLTGTSRDNRRTVKTKFLFQHQADAHDITIKRNDETLWMEVDPESDEAAILKPMLPIVKQHPATPMNKISEALAEAWEKDTRWGYRMLNKMHDYGLVRKIPAGKATYIEVIEDGK